MLSMCAMDVFRDDKEETLLLPAGEETDEDEEEGAEAEEEEEEDSIFKSMRASEATNSCRTPKSIKAR